MGIIRWRGGAIPSLFWGPDCREEPLLLLTAGGGIVFCAGTLSLG